MKTSVHFTHRIPSLILLVLALVAGQVLCAQSAPELVFKNASLMEGTAGKDGAKYRFKNVTTGVDAIVEIKGRSANDVVLSTIDLTTSGHDKAFQPEVGIVGNVSAHRTWSMDFKVSFVENTSGKDKKTKLDKFVVTGLDIDGDGSTIKESVKMKKIKKAHFSPVNYLTDNLLSTATNLVDDNLTGEDHQITGPTQNFGTIDTSATSVMATYDYEKKDEIEFSIGGSTGYTGSSAGMRLNSLWFKSFNLAPPMLLPVNLLSFTAKYTKPNVTLAWSTTQEKNFSHFIVESSLNGKVYSQVAIVFGSESAGTTNYTYTDKSVAGKTGDVSYRLRSVDKDGKETYSSIQVVRLAGGEEKPAPMISAYPNPVVNEVRVTIPAAWQGKHIKIQIFNNNGLNVKEVNVSSAGPTEMISLNKLDKGMYIINATFASQSAQLKILKD